MNAAPDDGIDRFLDALLPALRGTPRDVRRALAECEDHLRDDAARRATSGATAEEAARSAVAAFGDVPTIAAGFNRAHRPAATRALLAEVPMRLWRVVAVGFVAVGVSGVTARAWSGLAGLASTFGDAPGVHIDAASCAHFLAAQPGTQSCATAALLEVRDDALVQRAAIGLLGLLLMGGSVWWGRRRDRRTGGAVDLAAPTALLAATVFGLVGVALAGYGVDRAVTGTGSGQWLSAGLIAIIVAAGYLAVLWQAVTTAGPARFVRISSD